MLGDESRIPNPEIGAGSCALAFRQVAHARRTSSSCPTSNEGTVNSIAEPPAFRHLMVVPSVRAQASTADHMLPKSTVNSTPERGVATNGSWGWSSCLVHH